jgi:hemerythrin-like domain-containing protein
VHAALRAVRKARASGVRHEAQSLREIVMRLGELQGSRHCSMTEALFARLRERTSTVDAELDELERQHQRAAQMHHELAALVASDQESVATGTQLEETLNACAQFTWEHMGREEGVVLPAARRYLRDADWNTLSEAFAALVADERPRTPTR